MRTSDPRDNSTAGARSEGVQTIDRAVSILDALADDASAVGVTELSHRVGLTKGTTYRLLSSLQHHGLVAQDANSRAYRLGTKLIEYGGAARNQVNLVGIAERHLRNLAKTTQEAAHLAILDRESVLYIAKVDGDRALRMPSNIGARNPIHCTAVGKVLIADLSDNEVEALLEGTLERFTWRTLTDLESLYSELAQIRLRGYAVDDQELEDGLRCVAAPIWGPDEELAGAVSVSGPTPRIPLSHGKQASIAPQLISAAAAISEELGFRSMNRGRQSWENGG